MWFFLAFFIAGFILTAFLSPKMKTENAKAAGLNEFNFPRSKEGEPVPRVYGTVKVKSPNTIGLNFLPPVPIKKKVKTGIFSSKKVVTGYQYFSTLDLALALGPGVEFRKMWFGENLVWTGCNQCYNTININFPDLYGGSADGGRGGIAGEMVLYCGHFDQPHDPVLEAQISADISAYPGIAHVVFRNFWFGNSPQIDTINFELQYFSNSLELTNNRNVMPNCLDINPVECLFDILVTGWGNLGFDPSLINVDGWREKGYQIWNENNGMSLLVGNPTDGTSLAKQILRQINGIVYEDSSTGFVELELLRNDYTIEELPVLSPSNVSEIRNYTKKLWSETNNVIRLKFTGRDSVKHIYEYDKIAVAKDSALLRYQGKERPVEITMPGVYEGALANELAARELSNLNVPIYSCELTMNRTVPDIKPGSVFVLNWPEFGIVQMVMRVRKMGMGALENNSITLSVVQDEFSLDATVVATPDSSGFTPTVIVPVDIDTYVLMELPAFLDYNADLGTMPGRTRLMSFAIAPAYYSTGYDAYIEEGAEDAQVLTLSPYSDFGRLADDIGRFDGWDTGMLDELAIKDVPETVILEGGPDTRYGGGIFLIGEELFAYEGAANDGDGNWTLHNVHRAYLDTDWSAHLTDHYVFFIDGQEGFFDDDSIPGEEQDIYLLDHTTAGTSSTDDAIVTSVTPVGRVERVVAPDYATANGSRTIWQEVSIDDVVVIDARARSRLDTNQTWYEDDAASTAETGTTYSISTEIGGVVTLVDDAVTLPYNLTITSGMTGQCIIQIRAKKDGLYSLAFAPMPLLIIENTLIDSDIIEIDGDTVEID